ncbi:MAG: type II toxin-antitoxin system VapC family toxin [Candidatus Kapabacteria bacterium]|nr:type II toxin-antitoxin system VapC family toxin [Candidatus Kapabacteria bacterium]
MAHKSVLLDTSFIIRLLKENDPLFNNANSYFRYFLDRDVRMFLSTISIAEYCAGGQLQELPLRNVQVLPFNVDHGQRAGVLARDAFRARNTGILQVESRVIIPNDTKLFAQADSESAIGCYVSADRESRKVYDALRGLRVLNFEFIDLHVPISESFGMLDL